ncbi:hypothetical protein FEZ48_02250 [Marinilactibacillus psychrotolerans]|uniref:Uncharacterized protein n=1 Tax=Marinilactibacillus psychrotolerans TaxID=191770 RepID=A0A5R9C734_9LACT|nr:hypothetical protein [Marinilactibacillus psychrotolerans]TLQ08995.1 hypothetical protein FEZ48_02250 [Marinilactibacillus psychrotolerans]
MNNTFQKRQAKKYYNKCHNFLSKDPLPNLRNNGSHVAERSNNEYYSSTFKHINTNELSGKNLEKVLAISFEEPHLFPDEQTYYIRDISENKETEYNSLLFSLREYQKKAKETTSVIMNRYFDDKRVPYSLMQKLGKPFGYKSTLPYVLGETCFVPDRGATKNSASWYSLHNISHFFLTQ